MRKLRQKKGQSTVEYVIVFTAIAVAIIFAATQVMAPAINSTFNQAGDKVQKAGDFFGDRAGFNYM